MRFDLRLLNFLAIIGCAAAFATPTLHGGSVDPAGAPAEAGDSSCGAIGFLAPHGIENFPQPS